MPPVVAAVSAAAWVGGLSAAGQFAVSMAASAALSLAASAVSSALAKTPSVPSYRTEQKGRTQVVRSAVEARKIVYGVQRVSGPLVFAASTGTDNDYAHIIVPLAAHQVAAIGDVYFNDRLSSAYDSGYFRIKKHLGAADQAADADLVAEVPHWTTAHRLRGIAYLYIRFKYSTDVFPSGLPNVSAEMTGKNDIYDPRDASTGYTNNAALCIRDYLSSELGLNLTDAELDDTALAAAANICDESVDLDAGGTETQVRYTCDGVVSTEYSPRDNIEALLSSCAGRLTFPGGVATLRVGAYETPTWSLDEDNLRAPIKIRPQNGRADLFNTVRGVYVSPDNAYQSTDFPEVTNATYVTQDNGEKIAADIDLPFTTNTIRAQRLAKIHLEEHRQAITVDYPANWSALAIQPGQTGTLSIDQLGWTDKVFRCDGWTLTPGGIDLVLREISSDAYSWNYGNATVIDAAPNTGLADPWSCQQPQLLTLSSGTDQLDVSGDGTVVSRILASWTAPADGYVTGYEVQYRKYMETAWKPAGSPTETQCYIAPVSDGHGYDVRVRSVNSIGVKSAWATASNHIVVGKSAAPSAPDTFLVSRQPDGTRQFAWTHADPDPDLKGYKIRYVSGSSGSWDSMTALHEGVLLMSPFETNLLDAGTWTFAIKSVDTSGNESESAVYITGMTLDSPRMGDVIYTDYPHSDGWPGTKTDCHVDNNGWLEADDSYTWDDFTTDGRDWDNWTQWPMDPASPITYEHTVIDLGQTLTFTPYIVADANGSASSQVDTSLDNSTWDGWQGSGSPATCRYLKVKTSISGACPVLRALNVFLSARAITEDLNDIDTSALTGDYRIGTGDIRLPIGETYNAITQVRLTLQGTGGGWNWKLIDKNTGTGPRVQIYDGTTPADATIDAEIKGY